MTVSLDFFHITGFLLRFVITGTFFQVRGTKMAAVPSFLATQWQVGVGVGGGRPSHWGSQNFKILGSNGCILGFFCTLSVLILAGTCIMMRHSLL